MVLPDKKILIKKISALQELHRQGLEEATLIMGLLTEDVSTPSKTHKKKRAVVKSIAVSRRNTFIHKIAANNN